MAHDRRTHCNPDVEPPPAEPPGSGAKALAKAVKARDLARVVDELYEEDSVPPGLSAADRKRIDKIRLSIRMAESR